MALFGKNKSISESGKTFKAILDGIGEGVFIIDEDMKIDWVNPIFEQWAGKLEYIKGKNCYKVFKKRDFPCENCPAVKTFKTGKIEKAMQFSYDTQGNIKHYELTTIPMEDEGGRIIAVMGLAGDLTEKIKLEHKRLHDVLEAMPIMVCLLTPDYQVAFANRAFRDKFGESHGRRCYEYCFGKKEPCDFCETYRVLKTGKPHHWQVTTPDGASVIDVYDFPFTDVDGSPMILEMDIDITESKKAEAALRKNINLLKDTGEMAKVGGWELDLATKEVSLTEEVARIHGVGTRYKMSLEEAKNFYAPESIPILEATLKKTIETGEPYVLESLFIPSGSKDKIWVRSLGRAIYSGGKIVKLAGTFQNIDKYKRAEEALRTSEIKNRILIENLPQKIFFKDRNSVYISCNENFAGDLKIKAEEITGKTDYEFYPKELAEIYRADDKRIMESGKIEDIEEKYVQDGQEIFVNTVKTPVRDDQGNVVGILVIFRDITERKRAEKTTQTFAELGLQLAKVDKLESLAIPVAKAVDTLLQYDVFLFCQRLPAGEMFQIVYAEDIIQDKRQVVKVDDVPIDIYRPLGNLLQEEPFMLNRGPTDELQNWRRFGDESRPSASLLFAPVCFGDEVCGLLSAQSYTPQRYQAADLAILKSIADTIAPALRRVQMEKNLRESEEKYRLLIENVNDAIVISQNDKFIFFNPRFAEMLGYKPEELLMKDYREVYTPESIAILLQRQEKRIRGEPVPERYETVFRKKDGATIGLEANIAIIDYDGVPATFAVLRDITERKKAEIREKISHDTLALLNVSQDTTGTIASILQLITQSMGFEAIGVRLREGEDFPYYETKGFSEDFVLKERYLCARDDKGNIIRNIEGNAVLECMCGNILSGRFDANLPFFTEGGSFWTNSTTDLLASTTEKERQSRTRNRCNTAGYESLALIPLKAGRSIIGLLQINDHKRDSFTLDMIHIFEGLGASIGIAFSRQQAEKEIRNLAKFPEEISNPIYRVSKDGVLLYANPASRRLIFEDQTRIGDKIPEKWIEIIKNVYDSGKRQQIEVELGGRVFLFDLVPVIEDGYVNSYASDITELKKVVDQLLFQERLAVMGELAAGIAHEIRNPLGSIAASSQFVLGKYKLTGQVKKHLKIIIKNSENANRIIKDLLDFAKPREISFKPGHIGEVINSACNLVKARCAKQRVRLKRKWSRRIPHILLDEKQLEEAFLNFILNALDAMPSGGSLMINANLDFQTNDIIVSFLDTGSGISPENINKLFTPFFTTKEEGVGLGLAVARNIIKSHKGRINIESKVGQGTEVVVRLPFQGETDKEKQGSNHGNNPDS